MSVARGEIYKCRVCGIVAEIIDAGAGEPVCCGQPMTLLELRPDRPEAEMHPVVVDRQGDSVTVRVGPEPDGHPMEARHFIQWIEVTDGSRVQQQYLQPGQACHARFDAVGPKVRVRALCNLHGLW